MPLHRRLALLLLSSPLLAAAATGRGPLRLCVNQALGEPSDNNSGFLLARLMAERLGEATPQYASLPWQRCLTEAAAGQHDGVLAASYTAERAEGLAYPRRPDGQPDEERRMFRVGYVLLRRKGTPVRWDGRRFHGSSPRAGEAIGAERAYSIVQFARDRGAVVEDRYPSFGSLVDALRLKRSAGVLINQEGAAQLLADPAWAQDHELGGPPLQQRAYYLALAKRFAEADPARAEALWRAVAEMRNSPAFQRRFSDLMSGGRRRDLMP